MREQRRTAIVKAMIAREFGGPEVLTYVDLPDPVPQAGEQVYPVRAAGINFADTHSMRKSPLTTLVPPFVPGIEVVVDLPDGSTSVAMTRSGAYATQIALARDSLFAIPDGVTPVQALALVVQGVTAWHLLQTAAHHEPGETVLVHAGAGGVGTIAIQLARCLGAGRVIATASTAQKREVCLGLGADAVLDSLSPTLAEDVRDVAGKGIDVALAMSSESVSASVRSLARRGRLVIFGMSPEEPPKPISPLRLMTTSTSAVGFFLRDYLRTRDDQARPLADLFDLVLRAELTVVDGGRFPLAQAQQAQERLLARESIGKLTLDTGASSTQ